MHCSPPPSVRSTDQHIRGSGFWDAAKKYWLHGASCLFHKDAIKVSPFYETVNFAGPEPQWARRHEPKPHLTRGTVVSINIEGAVSDDQHQFVRDLSEEINRRKYGRPLFSERADGKTITYKCLKDLPDGSGSG